MESKELGNGEKEISLAEANIINDIATTNDEMMVAYGFALDAGYQGSFEDYKEWRMKQPEFNDER